MRTLSYTFIILKTIVRVLFHRLIGIKKDTHWSLKTELIWATTRATLLSANSFGIPWLKALTNKYHPKPSSADRLHISNKKTEHGDYKNVSSDNALNKLIIYFHGGGYVTGSPDAIIEFISNLAISTKAFVAAPYYPTAPEKTYPSAQVFAIDIVKSIIRSNPGKKIYLAGDSAGAALILSTMQHIDITKIEGCILISPWTEPLSITGSVMFNAKTDVGNPEFLKNCYTTYVNDTIPLDEYPLTFNEHNLKKLPSTLITIGTHEMLLDQALKLGDNLKNKGTTVEILKYRAMFHTFWNMGKNLKEANKLIQDIATWMAKSDKND